MPTTNLSDQPGSDAVAQQAFAQKALSDVVGFMNVFVCVLGDRLGLFKDLAANGPASSAELAARTGIAERYALEWLSQMTCAEYLKYDPATKRFSLPPEHVPTLAAEGRSGFLGGSYQNKQSIENGMFSKLIQAFRDGSGIAYTDYDDNFWDGGDRFSAANLNDRLVEVYLPAMPEVKAKLDQGAQVVDVGCGRGGIIIALAKAFPKATFIGYDNFEPNIVKAKGNAQIAGVEDRVRFNQHDTALGLPEKADIILSNDSLHHATNILSFLRAVRAGLKVGGFYVCLEAACSDTLEGNIGPCGALAYASSLWACVPQVLSEGGEAVGRAGLSPVRMHQLCGQAGFSGFRHVLLVGEASNVYEVKA